MSTSAYGTPTRYPTAFGQHTRPYYPGGRTTLYPTKTTLYPEETVNFTCPSKKHPYIFNYENTQQFTITDQRGTKVTEGLKYDSSVYVTSERVIFIKRTWPTDPFVLIKLTLKSKNIKALSLTFVNQFYKTNQKSFTIEEKIRRNYDGWNDVVIENPGTFENVYQLRIKFKKFDRSSKIEIRDLELEVCLKKSKQKFLIFSLNQ